MKKFVKDKYLRKIKIENLLKNYSRYLYLNLLFILFFALGIYFAYSKFFVSKEEVVIKTTVGNFIQGDVIIGAYIDNEYSSTIPGKNDGYAVEKVVCDNEATGEWDEDKWGLLTTNLTKRTKCNVYFKKVVSKVPDIIATVDTSGNCPSVNEDGSVSVTTIETTNGYLCKAKDAYGDSYYYRGNVTNNYVLFADKYWRIVRINGDRTVRVIYDGTSAHANGESSSDRQIGISAFNGSHNSRIYVGYMYSNNTNNSGIKSNIDNWYKANLLDTSNEQFIVDNIFCNDRSLAGNDPGSTSSTTYYRWYNYPWQSESYSKYNNIMKLVCTYQTNAFTVSDTTNGNGALMYPVGLLSMDELILAGGWNKANNSYYLYTGQIWWTSSPNRFENSLASGCIVYNDGSAAYRNSVNGVYGVRPVLNLKAEVLKNGDGTMNNPYRLEN